MSKSASSVAAIDRRIGGLFEKARPDRDVEPLLKILAGSDSQAVVHWQAWRTSHAIENATSQQWRLLGAVGRKLLSSEIDPAERAQLKSVKLEIWRDNQLRINRQAVILKGLHEANIPMMVLKGGARFASEAGALEVRFARDIDLLFPADRLIDALDALLGMGMRSVNGRLPGMVKSQAFALLYPPGPRPHGYLEIDVHSVPLRLGRRAHDEHGLWDRSMPGTLGGIPVRVPSPADRFVHAIGHGLVADDDDPVDWVADVLAVLRDPAFDPQIVIGEIRNRRLGVPIAIGSLYLRNVLGAPMPDEIIEACRRDVFSLIYRLEMQTVLKLSRQRSLFDRAIAEFAERDRVAGRDTALRSWNTSWLLRPSFRSPGSDWVVFQNGVATIKLASSVQSRNGRLRLFIHCPRSSLTNQSFDVLLDGIWIGRIRLRAITVLRLIPHRCWVAEVDYRLPLHRTSSNQSTLEVVMLDHRKMPTIGSCQGTRAAADI